MSKTSVLSILVFAASLCASKAYATTTSTTCIAFATTVNNPTSCLIPLAYGEVDATATVHVSDGLTGYVSAEAEAGDTNGSYSTSASALADGSSEFTSSGAFRLGKIVLQSFLFGTGDGPSDISISDGTHTYSYACASGNIGCHDSQVLPFFLGSNFFITMSQSAEADASKRFEDLASSFSFTLQEIDGTTAQNQLISTPEPSTSLSVLLAALVGFSMVVTKKLYRACAS